MFVQQIYHLLEDFTKVNIDITPNQKAKITLYLMRKPCCFSRLSVYEVVNIFDSFVGCDLRKPSGNSALNLKACTR